MTEMVPRKLAVIMHADVVGSTELVRRNESLAHQRIKDAFLRFSKAVQSYGGTAHELRGDALVSEFSRASDAVCAAVTFQKENNIVNASMEDDLQPRLRVGIAMGEVVIADNTVTGEGVVLAQRLEQVAEPGGVCIQGAAYETVPKRLPFSFESLGEQRLKGFDEAVRAYAVKLKAGAAIPPPESSETSPGAGAISNRPSIAVLPFINLSHDPEQEYFSDGLTEDIITALSRFHSLFVIARNSTFAFKGQAVNVQHVGKQLGASYVIEGSVRKAGNRIRVTAQLIDSESGNHFWAENYDRDLDDIFTVQDEVTASIVSSLPERVGAADLHRVRRKRTDEFVAYDYFLRGRELHHAGTKEANNEGIRLLEKAVELDPGFAQAWAWLSCIIGQAWVRDYLPGKAELWTRCVAAANRALELDEEDSECHRILSEVYLLQRQFEEAEYHNDRGLSLNPNDPRLVVQRGYLLAYIGRATEGLEWIYKVLRLDPFHPENYYANLGIVLHAAHRYSEAIEAFKKVPQLQLSHHAYLASSHAHLGQNELATDSAHRVLELDPKFRVSTYSTKLQYKLPADLEHFVSGLRQAGLPEN